MRRGGTAPDGPGKGGGIIDDRAGFVRFRHWCRYGEADLAGDQAAVRRYGEHPTAGFADEPLAQKRVAVVGGDQGLQRDDRGPLTIPRLRWAEQRSPPS